MATLNIRDVRKSYGAHQAIHGVSLDIEDGEFVVLVGPSGCGKSTLLRMIAGLEGITAGEIRIGPRVVNDLHPKDRDIAMVFQNYALYPHMSVEGNMTFGLRLRGVPRPDRQERVGGAAGLLDIGGLLDRLPANLSGGQRQRVAMGRAIVREPKAYLFDEPLSNLDAKLRVAMRAEIKALQDRLGTTTVYVTHDQIEAMTMADRIVVMNAGRIEQVGRPLDLYDRPANLFVAGFIGSPAMNLLRGTLRPGGRDVFVTDDGLDLPVPPGVAAPPGPAIYGLRPEHVRLDPDGVALRTRVVEPTGAEVQILGELGGQTFMAVLRDRILPRPGEVIRIGLDARRALLFDVSTGVALGP